MMRRDMYIGRICSLARRASRVACGTALLLAAISAHAAGVPYQPGDVFAGVGNGQIKHFSSSGVLLDTLSTGSSAPYNTGMAFDAAGNLIATAFGGGVYKFDNKGNLIGAFGTGYNADPESVVLDKDGNVYVGQADGNAEILKFSSAGTLLASFAAGRQNRGTDWIDLAADQCTMHYTSEGSSIDRYDVCANQQLTSFVSGLQGPCYAHRIRPNGEELVACSTQIYRLSGSGAVVKTYSLPGETTLFALTLDPDDSTFWTGGLASFIVYRVNIDTGAIVTSFNTAATTALGGLTVAGEITAAVPTNIAFAAFCAALEVSREEDESISEFELQARFTLGATSKGIDPLTQPVTLSLASATFKIPANSFHPSGKNRYAFRGTINGAKLNVRIARSEGGSSYTLSAEGKVDRSQLTAPVKVALTIGTDGGVTTASKDECEGDDSHGA